jgi:hypothetical protein
MNPQVAEPYEDVVYKALKAGYGDKWTITPDEFKTKLSTPEYQGTAYSALKALYKDKWTISPEEFGGKLTVKKKNSRDFLEKCKKVWKALCNSLPRLLKRTSSRDLVSPKRV